MGIREEICRLICTTQGINPDRTGWAMNKDTLDRLGSEYPLWKYQIPVADAVIERLTS